MSITNLFPYFFPSVCQFCHTRGIVYTSMSFETCPWQFRGTARQRRAAASSIQIDEYFNFAATLVCVLVCMCVCVCVCVLANSRRRGMKPRTKDLEGLFLHAAGSSYPTSSLTSLCYPSLTTSVTPATRSFTILKAHSYPKNLRTLRVKKYKSFFVTQKPFF